MIKLYYSDVLAPRKACAVARYLQAPLEFVYLDLGRGEHKRPEYLALNPNGKVPTLVDGTSSLWEANAIMCELARRAGSDLWPADHRQVEVMRWLSWDLQHFNRCAGLLFFEGVIKPRFGMGPPDAEAVSRARDQFRTLATVLDAHLEQRDWLVGNRLSVADFAVASTLPYAEPARIPLHEFAAVRRWHDRLWELEAWREPFPRQTTAPKAETSSSA